MFADALSHAVLRGRLALEHSYFVTVEGMQQPELAPLSILTNSAHWSCRRAA